MVIILSYHILSCYTLNHLTGSSQRFERFYKALCTQRQIQKVILMVHKFLNGLVPD